MVSPSLMAMVLNSMGVPPAARTPSFTFAESRRRWKLQGMVSIQVLATPIKGLARSSLVKPMALNMERAPARSRPSVIRRLRCFGSIDLEDYDSEPETESDTQFPVTLKEPVISGDSGLHSKVSNLPCGKGIEV